MKTRLTIFLLVISQFFVIAVTNGQKNEQYSKEEIENYKKQAEGLVRFLEGTLNFIGDAQSTTKEKDVVLTSSYLKIFRDDKVQIEDDLDEKRDVPLTKDIQAYLKDIDFFFKKVKFEFTIDEISHYFNGKNQLYFKVTIDRNLKGTTISNDTINSNKVRYIEINLLPDKKELKIASIYTTGLNEAEELQRWWETLPAEWIAILGKNVPLGENISLQQIKTILKTEDISISGNGKIDDINPLRRLSGLKRLNVSGTTISDLLPLRNLTKLESVDISGTNIKSLDPLKYSSNLKELICNDTKIENLDVLENFQQLEKLYCFNTGISSVNVLEGLKYLKDLRINNTAVSSLKALEGLTNLEILKCSDTKITSLEAIGKLTALQHLFVDNTLIPGLDPLKWNMHLNTLSINKTPVASLEVLSNLPELVKVYCENTQITKEKANQFMLAHPSILVIFDSESQKGWWNSLSDDWKSVFRKYQQFDNPPTKEQLQKIVNLTSIDVSENRSINSLEPLRKLINLQELNCNRTSVESLEPLKDLFDLKTINASYTKVNNLDPLAALTNLKSLMLVSIPVTSLTSLKTLTKLEFLNIEKTAVTDITALNSLTYLKNLYCDKISCDKQKIEQFVFSHSVCLVIYQTEELKSWWEGLSEDWKKVLSALEKLDKSASTEQLHKLTYITELEFNENYGISNLEPVRKLRFLKTLKISDTDISNIDPVSELIGLEVLQCSNSPVIDLTPVISLVNLKYLNCSNTRVNNLSPINGLLKLENLNISGSKVRNLSALSNLNSITHLDFHNTKVLLIGTLKTQYNLKVVKCYNTRVFKSMIEKFKKSNPECRVIYF